MRILLLGPPGAGKGTLGKTLAAYYDIPHVAAGDIIRQHIAEGTEFGRRVEKQIAAGNFAPDDDIIYWIGRQLVQADAKPGYVLDGFPRDLAQARAFDTQSHGDSLDAVLELQAAEGVLWKRLEGRRVCPQCGRVYHIVHCTPRLPGLCDADGTGLVARPDDSREAVLQRLMIYEQMTVPLREYYAARHLIFTLDVDASMGKVSAEAIARLKSLAVNREKAQAGV